ncbi:MAG: acyl-CoA dehydrogenase [Coxiella sp. (in: Bacteria)]|nr:MAG: acyl-CoA dehydrogenase [Coxiella sp. (in: g-proteobacteria)]
MTFNWQDPLSFNDQLATSEHDILLQARDFCERELQPRVEAAFRSEQFDPGIMKCIASAGFFDSRYTAVQQGLIAREFERVDSGYRTLLSVTTCLVMKAIEYFGSDAQCERWLPALASGDKIGCFGLSEPQHGSDPQHMEARAEPCAQGIRLTGQKRWIGLANVADVFIIWARDTDNAVQGYLVEKEVSGLSIEVIEGKFSLRTVPSCDITFDNVVIPSDSMLPKSEGLKSALRCLNHARYGIGWGALGAAEACFHAARDYIVSRNDFASKQFVQQKLADMSTEIALGLQACLQVGRCLDTDNWAPEQVSLIKRNSTLKALHIARQARDILGGNGIVDTFGVMRHLLNLESVVTYKGTADIHSLILGRGITGVNAF